MTFPGVLDNHRLSIPHLLSPGGGPDSSRTMYKILREREWSVATWPMVIQAR